MKQGLIETNSLSAKSGAIVAFLLTSTWIASTALGQQSDQGSDKRVLEEVIVTATRREQPLQTTPMSVTAVTETQITQFRLDSIETFQHFVPGLAYTQATSAQRSGPAITIRGIFNQRIVAPSDNIAAQTTGYYINEVATLPVDLKLYDVNRIEVLKGPQGTLYGVSSMGGTVKMILNEPDAETFSGDVQTSGAYRSDGDPTFKVDGMVNIPILEDVFALRLVGYYRSEGGFVDVRNPLIAGFRRGRLVNTPPEGGSGVSEDEYRRAQRIGVTDNANSAEAIGGRVSAKLIATDNFTLSATAYYQKRSIDDDSFYHKNLADEGLVRENYTAEAREEKFQFASLDLDYGLPFADIKSITGYFKRTFAWSQDVTSITAAVYGTTVDGNVAAAASLDTEQSSENFSQEVRLQSNEGGSFDGLLDWVIGVHYLIDDRLKVQTWMAPGHNANAAPGSQIPNNEDFVIGGTSFGDYESLSFFGDATFHFGDLSVSAGVRYADQDQQDDAITVGPLAGLPNGQSRTDPTVLVSETSTTPRYNVAYQFTDDHLIYASAAEGFRTGGRNRDQILLQTNPACAAVVAGLGLDPRRFDSDSVLSYEIGAKTSWAENRFIVNVAAYQTDWDDLQVGLRLTDFNALCPVSIVANAGSAQVDGFELSVSGRVFESFDLGATVNFIEARFDAPPQGVTAFAKGQPVPNVPDLTMSAYARYSFPIMNGFEGYVLADWSYTDETFVSGYNPRNPNPFLQMSDYNLFNVSFGMVRDSWETVVFVDNVTDEAADLGGGLQAGESFSNQVFVNSPRSIGVRIRKRF